MIKDEHESYTFASYVVYLWDKRVWLIAGAILCAAITWIYVKYIAKEKYRSYSQIMIKEPKKITDSEIDSITPLTYKDILLNDGLIRQVRDEFCKTVGIATKGLPIEKFREGFEIKSQIVKDTTIKIEYSPVINLSVDADTPERARALMDIWIKTFMKYYGDILARNASYLSRDYGEMANKLSEKIEEKEAALYKLRWEIPFKIRQLASNEMLLAPAQINWEFRGDQRRSYFKYRDSSEVNIAMQEPPLSPAMVNGLKEQLIQTELELAAAKVENNAAKIVPLEAKQKALQEKIAQTTADIAALQRETAALETQFQTLAREVIALRDQYTYLSDLKNHADVDAHSLEFANNGDGMERSDVAIISPPSLAELKSSPKRVLATLLAAVIGSILTALALILDKFICDGRAMMDRSAKA